LLAALHNDSDSKVRENAAAALGTLKALEAVPALLAALHNDSDSWVHKNAAAALGEIKAPEATHGLLAALHSREYGLRRSAVDALRKIKVPEAVPDLLGLLETHREPWPVGDDKFSVLVAWADASTVVLIFNDILGHRQNAFLSSLPGFHDDLPVRRSRRYREESEVLWELAPLLHVTVRDDWPIWRKRLMGPTQVMLSFAR
jgi:hypothetical protein